MSNESLYLRSRFGNVTYEIEPYNRKTSGRLPVTLLSMSEDNNMAGVYVASGLPRQPLTGLYGAGIAPDLAREAQPKTVTYTVLFDQGTGNDTGTRGYLRDFTHFLRAGILYARHGQYGGIGWDGYLADTPQVAWLDKRETQAKVTFTLTYMTPFLSYHNLPNIPAIEVTANDYVVRTAIDYMDGSAWNFWVFQFPATPYYSSIAIIPTSASAMQAAELMTVYVTNGKYNNKNTVFSSLNTRTNNITLNTTYKYVYTSLGLTPVGANNATSAPNANLVYGSDVGVNSGSLLLPPSQAGHRVYFSKTFTSKYADGVPFVCALVKATP